MSRWCMAGLWHEPYLRISYATDTESLREACTRIQEFCKGLS
jgi:aspartate aminotransferase